mmetsp:Transcript_14559/g.22957  ORF Transcript_14559/g.22957 Transcript_14559/m.22957 type:complete len:93 (-) Transcript_14559:1008-1286(-)
MRYLYGHRPRAVIASKTASKERHRCQSEQGQNFGLYFTSCIITEHASSLYQHVFQHRACAVYKKSQPNSNISTNPRSSVTRCGSLALVADNS